MKIRLERIDESEPFVWQETFEVDASELDETEVVEISGVEVVGKVTVRPALGYHLEAEVSYQQSLRCTRCLTVVDPQPAHVAIDMVARVSTSEAEEVAREKELQVEDLGIVLLTEPVVDTRPLAVEQMLLSVPMKFLCREECKGLCSQCGSDLNTSRCSCRAPKDPRWSGLEALRQDG